MVIHTVKRGDSIYSIANRYGVSIQQIISDNALDNPDQIMVGQAIVVSSNTIRHTVARGQSLYTIAQTYGTTINNIVQANPGITDPAKIYVGQVLRIPVPAQKLGTIDVNGFAFTSISSNTLNNTLPHLTYLSFFSHQVSADGSLSPLADASARQRARQQRVAPWFVITNIREGGGFDSDVAHAVLSSTQVQNTLIENVVNNLAQEYTGLVIDFEYIYSQDRENYNNFLRRITDRLHSLGYTVATALAPKISGTQRGLLYEGHDYPVHGAIVDYVILMTYEWGYTYGPPQAVAPLNQVESVLRYATSVIPSRKIMMGIPNYGYDWTLPFVQGSAARSLSNTAAARLAVTQRVEIHYDATAQTPFFHYYDSNGRQHEVWFEDARSIQAKLALVNKYKLGGVSYWTVNSFFPQNWVVLEAMYTVRKVL